MFGALALAALVAVVSSPRLLGDEIGDALGELAAALLSRLGSPAEKVVPLVTDGGFIRAGADLLLPRLLAGVRARGFAVAHRMAGAEAAHGAVALAREIAPGTP